MGRFPHAALPSRFVPDAAKRSRRTRPPTGPDLSFLLQNRLRKQTAAGKIFTTADARLSSTPGAARGPRRRRAARPLRTPPAMLYLDLTLPTPEANLACDEALLDHCEEERDLGILRFWESPEPFVVLGLGSRYSREADAAACEARGIPILRRCSGGGAVVQGPGCLSYALVLRIEENGPLERIDTANAFVMERHRRLLADATGLPVRRQGATDLTVRQRKFSGNAQRRRRRFLLFHGTFLLDFPIGLMEEVLPHPPKAPRYRGRRPHRAFLTNLDRPAPLVKGLLKRCWNAAPDGAKVPADAIESLVERKYSLRSWTERR